LLSTPRDDPSFKSRKSQTHYSLPAQQFSW
jgi:hypothetical protein